MKSAYPRIILAMLTRRCLLGSSLAASAWLSLGCNRYATAKPDPSRVATLAKAYLAAYDVPGLSLAYGRGERIVFAQGYGVADRYDHQPVTPQNLFRIASVSKPITSAAEALSRGASEGRVFAWQSAEIHVVTPTASLLYVPVWALGTVR